MPHRRRRGLLAVVEGFSLHAGTWVHRNDRQGLVRHGARGPVSKSRLNRLPDGRYRYAPKGDGPAVGFTAEALVKRLVALLPAAHKHLTSFHGVYAPNARLRPVAMRGAVDAFPPPPQAQFELDARGDDTRAAVPKPPRLDWATF